MKRIMLILLLYTSSLSLMAQGFHVNECNVSITINRDGTLDIIEKYDIDFTTPKHGIFLNIETSFILLDEKGKEIKQDIKIKKIDVPNH